MRIRSYRRVEQSDEARRCIGEAITAAETTGEKWCEADLHRTAGEIELMSRDRDAAKAQVRFERALEIARATGALLGAARGDEPRAAMA